MDSVWILGDQLNPRVASLADTRPGDVRVLMVESRALLESRRWHRQRLHLVLASMRRFAAELADAGYEVDYRRAASLAEGLAAHRERHAPASVRAAEPSSWGARQLLERLGVELLRSTQFLCHYEDFAEWAGERESLRLEDFYRWQRRRLDYLMEGDQPAGGRWNYDAENRDPPPQKDPGWPEPARSRLDELDREVLDELPGNVFGEPPDGTWATSRRAALARLRAFVERALPGFGPHQDAMTTSSWHLSHALLSPYLNLGLIHPSEVCDAVEDAWRAGDVPIASAEGMIRQIIGWREFVWGVYWLWMPGYRERNGLLARRPLPPAFLDASRTRMRCLADAVGGVEARAYAHHIQRLMVLGNLGLIAGIRPDDLVEWMWASFIDGAEWVMVPNVVSMALYADGGRMVTKPYAAGGAYIRRMSDYCKGCAFDPRRRTGDDACPFTTLYWSFLDRNRARLAGNARVARQLANLDRLGDLDEVRNRGRRVLELLGKGEL